MINKYSFGNMTIREKEYHSDLIIYKNSVNDTWWRKEGHCLSIEDIEEIIDKKPEVLIIGTGAHGLMKISPSLIKYLELKNIRVIVKKTKEAVEEYNQLYQNIHVIAAFHLTC